MKDIITLQLKDSDKIEQTQPYRQNNFQIQQKNLYLNNNNNYGVQSSPNQSSITCLLVQSSPKTELSLSTTVSDTNYPKNSQPRSIQRWNEFLNIEQVKKLFFPEVDQQYDQDTEIEHPNKYLNNIQKLFHFNNDETSASLILPKMPTKQQYLQRLESLKQQPKQSKFHNKQKVMLNKILRFFLKNNLKCLFMPKKLLRRIMSVIEKVKETGYYTVKGIIRKSDLFNQNHYNLVFLKITLNSLEKMCKNQKDIDLHKKVFQIDITNIDGSRILQNEQVKYINFIKYCIYEIVDIHLKQTFLGEIDKQEEREFEYRAFTGIQQMSLGYYVNRF